MARKKSDSPVCLLGKFYAGKPQLFRVMRKEKKESGSEVPS